MKIDAYLEHSNIEYSNIELKEQLKILKLEKRLPIILLKTITIEEQEIKGILNIRKAQAYIQRHNMAMD